MVAKRLYSDLLIAMPEEVVYVHRWDWLWLLVPIIGIGLWQAHVRHRRAKEAGK